MTKRALTLASILGSLLATACLAPPLPEATVDETTISTRADWSKFGLAANDILRVTVFDHPEYSTPPEGTRVDLQGHLSLPLVGPLDAVGKTVEEFRHLVAESLSTYVREPSVSVSVVDYGSRLVYVFGHVDRPGAYTLDRPLNALQVLSLAGAFQAQADRENVVLMRGEGEEVDVLVFNAATPGPDGFAMVQPDDFVFIRQLGAGTFTEEALPIITALTSSASAVSSLAIAEEVISIGG